MANPVYKQVIVQLELVFLNDVKWTWIVFQNSGSVHGPRPHPLPMTRGQHTELVERPHGIGWWLKGHQITKVLDVARVLGNRGRPALPWGQAGAHVTLSTC